MKRLAITLMVIGTLALPAAASAHPSENRNSQGFGGGPHCHIVLTSGSRAYPSHMAHSKQNALGPAGAVFTATACD